MDSVNYVAQLNEYVQKSRCELKYDDIGSDGPAHIKTFTQRVILNGQSYPEGTGKNKKEARQNAAKQALSALEINRNHSPDSGLSVSLSPQPVCQARLTQPNYICWLNEHSQRNRVSLLAEESTKMDQGHATALPFILFIIPVINILSHSAQNDACGVRCCRFVLDGRKYTTASGRTKKEAKEEAAKLAYEEICSSPTSRAVDQSCSVESSSHQTNELNQDISEGTGKLGNLEVSTREHHLTETNYIGLLNHYCQKTMRSLDFSLVDRRGPAHCPQFFYNVVIDGKEYTEAVGKTAKEAKQKAANLAWSALQDQPSWDSKVSLKSAMSEEDATSNTAPTETFLNEFDNIEPLGKGGFGRVFKARQKHLQQDYAVKIVRCKEKALREAGVLSKLQHCNIIRYYSSWIEHSNYKIQISSESSSTFIHIFIDILITRSSTDASVPYLYIQMELCKIKNLQKWIDEKNMLRRDPNRGKDSLTIMRKLMCGVNYIHSENLIHRDLKVTCCLGYILLLFYCIPLDEELKDCCFVCQPSNIMFGLNGEVKIGDFGLVTEDTEDDANMLERTRCTGTRSFMAPEQRSENVYDRKVDIFALGLIYFLMLWKMLTGQEKAKVWDGIRQQTFPPGFAQTFPKEVHLYFHQVIIHLMLHDKSEERPIAKQIMDKLDGSDFLQIPTCLAAVWAVCVHMRDTCGVMATVSHREEGGRETTDDAEAPVGKG
ncbi:Interferon-induced, double-stranded RNA-activated protein kinase [Merluccius polli]|uniref:non-specific serine/threonine protein kinase n=1 Tax=Merluccius polli TaxID=89951 RepID=A0AA47N8D1_MERPO|nr:Interferon-induced, double-stranded RNA-activated protein kinase [Merluccius polli]